MRQSDIIARIGRIIVHAGVDASPDNYEVCHRYVVRSDPKVCAAFEKALAQSEQIDAPTFHSIREAAGPPPGHIDVAQHIALLDQQITAIVGEAEETTGAVAPYSALLTDGAARLGALDLGAEALAIINNLAAHTQTMAARTTALETTLVKASAELTKVRADLDRARHESCVDALTSLPNRSSFDSLLCEAVEEATTSKQPLSLAFCDIDHFRKYIDNWGHKLSDEVLRYVAGHMVRFFGSIGVPARFAGDTFVVLLPQHDAGEATASVRRFCQLLSSRVLRRRRDGKEVGVITMSVGVATLQPEETPLALIERADLAMYSAKKAARHRIASAAA